LYPLGFGIVKGWLADVHALLGLLSSRTPNTHRGIRSMDRCDQPGPSCKWLLTFLCIKTLVL
jgi:hypothetical protein